MADAVGVLKVIRLAVEVTVERLEQLVDLPLPDPDASDKVHEDDPRTKQFVAEAWAQFSAGFGSGK